MHILLIKTSSMGDIIHALPALSDAQKNIPDIKFDWVVEESFAEIPRWHSGVDVVIPVALRRWRKNCLQAWRSQEIKNFWREVQTTKYDYIIDGQGLYKSAFITWLAHGIRCGYDFHSSKEPLATALYQHKFNVSKQLHAIARLRLLFAKILKYKISIIGNDDPVDYGIKAKFTMPVSINGLNIDTGQKYLVFVHGSSRQEKCWDVGKWQELIRIANQYQYRVLLPWGNVLEQQRADYIAKDQEYVQILPRLSLTEMVQIISHAAGVVAVDTGLGHLAAALEVPTLSLYGPTAPLLIGTCGKKVLHVSDMRNIMAIAVWQKLASLLNIEIKNEI